MLAPDLSTNRYSLTGLDIIHCNLHNTSARSCYFSSLPQQCCYWAICAPAAILRCGSRFSGSLSGIEPQFPVTRKSHGSPLHYRQKLIGQILLPACTRSGLCAIARLTCFIQRTTAIASVDFRFGQLHPLQPRRVSPAGLDLSGVCRTGISNGVTIVIPLDAVWHLSGVDCS